MRITVGQFYRARNGRVAEVHRGPDFAGGYVGRWCDTWTEAMWTAGGCYVPVDAAGPLDLLECLGSQPPLEVVEPYPHGPPTADDPEVQLDEPSDRVRAVRILWSTAAEIGSPNAWPIPTRLEFTYDDDSECNE